MPEVISHRHGTDADLAAAISGARARIAAADRRFGTREQLLADLEVFSQCDFGRWMLIHGGWDAYWTRYVLDYVPPADPAEANSVELFFLTRGSGIIATRERAAIFNEVINELLVPGTVAMSVGCGYMDELLRVPNAGRAARLVGVDLDPEALTGAAQTAAEQGLAELCLFAEGDAWDLPSAEVTIGDQATYQQLVTGGIDLITSNGLNVYVEDDDATTALYRSFRRAMRPGGTLVVSAITPPEDWDFTGVDREESRRLRGLMLICDVMWSHYRSEATTRAELAEAGFEVADVRWDTRRIYPTFLAVAR